MVRLFLLWLPLTGEVARSADRVLPLSPTPAEEVARSADRYCIISLASEWRGRPLHALKLLSCRRGGPLRPPATAHVICRHCNLARQKQRPAAPHTPWDSSQARNDIMVRLFLLWLPLTGEVARSADRVLHNLAGLSGQRGRPLHALKLLSCRRGGPLRPPVTAHVICRHCNLARQKQRPALPHTPWDSSQARNDIMVRLFLLWLPLTGEVARSADRVLPLLPTPGELCSPGTPAGEVARSADRVLHNLAGLSGQRGRPLHALKLLSCRRGGPLRPPATAHVVCRHCNLARKKQRPAVPHAPWDSSQARNDIMVRLFLLWLPLSEEVARSADRVLHNLAVLSEWSGSPLHALKLLSCRRGGPLRPPATAYVVCRHCNLARQKQRSLSTPRSCLRRFRPRRL